MTFQGTGPSKQIAKNICAEHVIQHLVTKKCNESKLKVEATADGKPPVCTSKLGESWLFLYLYFFRWRTKHPGFN